MTGTRADARQLRTRLHRRGPTLAVIFALVTACSESPTTPVRRFAPSVPLFSATDITNVPILWNQGTFVGGHAHAMGDTRHAADFIVPPGAQWSISQLMLAADHPITYVNGQAFWVPVTMEIRADNAGAPGSVIQSYSLAPIDTESVGCTTYCTTHNNLYQLPAPLIVGPGTYWLAVGGTANLQFTWYGGSPLQGGEAQISFDAGITWDGEGNTFDFDFAVYGLDGTPANNAQNLQATLLGFGLPSGTATSLNAKLRSVLDAIQSGDTAAACSALKDFINEVNAQTGKKLTAAQAATLIAAATSLRTQLGC